MRKRRQYPLQENNLNLQSQFYALKKYTRTDGQTVR